jgi:sterol desaturase/sphingolipid hydroxylase (fatty acid hydroxylase superfamily)
MQNNKTMFRNPILEFLSRSNPLVILFLHLILISSVLGYGKNNFKFDWYSQISLFILGLITWTLAEYLIHRFVFHLTGKLKALKLLHYALHGHHHKNPTDKRHLFMPPIPVLFIVSIIFSLFYLIFGVSTFYFFPGFEFGYLVYSMIHYSVHVKPYSSGIMKSLWIHHGKHHFENSSLRYGVSSPFWDYIFRTLPDEK